MAITAAQLKSRLVDLLEVSKKEADNVLWAFSQIATETVEQGETIVIPGLGRLSCQVRPARKARNPRTGEAVQVPAKIAVKFKVAKSLSDSAPSLKTKTGRKLLEAAEEAQAKRDKARRKREKEQQTSSEKKSSSKKNNIKKSSTKKTNKKKKSSSRI